MLILSHDTAEKAVVDIYGHTFELDVENTEYQKLFLEIQSEVYNSFEGGDIVKIVEYIASGEFDNKKAFLREKINELIIKGVNFTAEKSVVEQSPTDFLPENKKSDFIFLSELYKSLTEEIQQTMNENAKKIIVRT